MMVNLRFYQEKALFQALQYKKSYLGISPTNSQPHPPMGKSCKIKGHIHPKNILLLLDNAYQRSQNYLHKGSKPCFQDLFPGSLQPLPQIFQLKDERESLGPRNSQEIRGLQGLNTNLGYQAKGSTQIHNKAFPVQYQTRYKRRGWDMGHDYVLHFNVELRVYEFSILSLILPTQVIKKVFLSRQRVQRIFYLTVCLIYKF